MEDRGVFTETMYGLHKDPTPFYESLTVNIHSWRDDYTQGIHHYSVINNHG